MSAPSPVVERERAAADRLMRRWRARRRRRRQERHPRRSAVDHRRHRGLWDPLHHHLSAHPDPGAGDRHLRRGERSDDDCPLTLAIVMGVTGVRRFWMADHRARWAYTIFIAVIVALLIVGIVLDLATMI